MATAAEERLNYLGGATTQKEGPARLKGGAKSLWGAERARVLPNPPSTQSGSRGHGSCDAATEFERAFSATVASKQPRFACHLAFFILNLFQSTSPASARLFIPTRQPWPISVMPGSCITSRSPHFAGSVSGHCRGRERPTIACALIPEGHVRFSTP